MGINQAIYTSSARGINKGGGMGIHTYNRACSGAELRKFERSYCQYHADGRIKDIHELPTKMIYGKIENGRYMAACVTYLGKDYDKERGRMGNLLSHMYSFSEDSLHVYPIQLFGSPDYRVSMAQAEVDGTQPVEYLPEVDAVKCGTLVDRESVQKFLRDGRAEMFCHLLSAVLQGGDDHKVIIRDTHENIVMWLGAIEFALPLQSAKEITFSSYEKNPLMSEFDVRGAVVGMSTGDYQEYIAGGQFFVFDGAEERYPKFDITASYFRKGLNMGMNISWSPLLDFFEFMSRYSYEKADGDIYSGFNLYQVIRGKTGQPEKNDIDAAMSFEARYGNESSINAIVLELYEKLKQAAEPDEGLLDNMRIVLKEYFKRKLNSDELAYGLALLGQLEGYVAGNGCNTLQNNKMWQSLYETFGQYQQKHQEDICHYFAANRLYQQLAEFGAYVYHRMDGEDEIGRLKSVFYQDWEGIVPAEYGYFDTVVCAAVMDIEKYEDADKKYWTAIELFLLLQDMGKGYIAGEGCEHLIGIVENAVCITDKKWFSRRRKKRNKQESDKKFAKFAQEVLRYSLKNRPGMPISRIRLRYLGMCIAEAYDKEEYFLKETGLKYDEKRRIDITDISDGELADYAGRLAGVVDIMELETEEYSHLLQEFWTLDKKQKEMFLRTYMDHEIDCFKKEKEVGGLASLLCAVRGMRDGDYPQLLNAYVSDMKESLKKQISKALLKEKKEYGLDKYWKSLTGAGNGVKTRKALFRRRKK